MTIKTLKRNIFQRIFGIPATKPPADVGSYVFKDDKLTIDLNRTPELSTPWGAIQLEDGDIPVKVLVLQDGEGDYRAFRNHCEHAGRKLDPVPGSETVQCCSIGKSVYDYDGEVLSGSSEKPITQYTVKVENGNLEIQL
jgi:nitrite reductase/ring-hydroxylating ferredoxin subunit